MNVAEETQPQAPATKQLGRNAAGGIPHFRLSTNRKPSVEQKLDTATNSQIVPQQTKKYRPNLRMNEKLKGIAEIAFALAFGILAFLLSPWLSENFAAFGYLGVFLFSLFASATIILPVPSWILVFSLSNSFNPLLLGLAAGLGSGLGELTGYFAGQGGTFILGKGKLNLLDEHKKWIKEAEFLSLFAASFFPNPLFDIAGLAAGMLKIPVWRFLFAVILGKTARFILFAYFGLHAFNGFS